MANSKSAKKRVLVTKLKRDRNKARKSELKTCLKKARADGAEAETVRVAVKHVDRAASKGLIHKNKAARIKSQLARKSNSASANV